MEAIDVEYRELDNQQLTLELLPPRVVAITGEINTYKEQAAMSIWEIGKRLTEAKDLLRHGQWTPWLTQFVDFSERNAQRYMKIFAAYSKPDTVSDLGLKKALILAALEPGDREDLLPEAKDLSADELKAAVEARQEAERRAAAAEAKQEDLFAQLSQAEEAKQAAVSEAVAGYRQTLESVRGENDRLVGELQAQKDAAKELEAKLQTAREAKKKAEEKYKTLKANPEIPEETLQAAAGELVKAAREEERAAAEKAAEDMKKKLAELTAERETWEKSELAAGERAANLEKQLALASPEIQAFQVHFELMQQEINRCKGLLLKLEPDMADKLRGALRTTLDRLSADI